MEGLYVLSTPEGKIRCRTRAEVVEVIADVMRCSCAFVLEDFRIVDFTESVPSLRSATEFLASIARPEPTAVA